MSIVFKTDTPLNIESFSDEELLALVEDRPERFRFGKKKRLSVARFFAEKAGLQLSKDHELFLISDSNRILVEAGAGGGKTTLVQLKILLEKVWRKTNSTTGRVDSNKIVSITFNEDNTKDVKIVHSRLYKKLAASAITGFDVDDKLFSFTMHSYAYSVLKDYPRELGIVFDEKTIMSQEEVYTLLGTCVSVVAKKENIEVVNNDPMIKALAQFYNLSKESMLDRDEWQTCPQFLDIGLKESIVEKIYDQFDRNKKFRKKLTFTDQLTKFVELLENNSHIQERLAKVNDIFVIDEYQDLSPLMIKVLSYFVGPESLFICIGDGDQTIYAFRGAGNSNCLTFKDTFENSKVFTFSKNRRCRENILNKARDVIELVSVRLEKNITPVKSGGNVKVEFYKNRETQMIKIAKMLKAMAPDDLDRTCVCYRNRDSSKLLTQVLLEHGVMFRVGSGYAPYTHRLYGIIDSVLDLLLRPTDLYTIKQALYRCLPITKSEVNEIMGWDEKERKFHKIDRPIHFKELDYGKHSIRATFVTEAVKLARMSDMCISGVPLKTYFPELFKMIKRYYWEYLKRTTDTSDEELESHIYEEYLSDKSYKDFIGHRDKFLLDMRTNISAGNGAYISTFHSLKGLEFNNVIVMDLDDNIFPNFDLIETRDYTDKMKQVLKDSETKLFYVTLTRAIDNLTLFFSDASPSYYVKMFKDDVNTSILVDDNKVISTTITPQILTPVENDFEIIEEKNVTSDEFEVIDDVIDIEEFVVTDNYIAVEESPLKSSNSEELKIGVANEKVRLDDNIIEKPENIVNINAVSKNISFQQRSQSFLTSVLANLATKK